MPSIISLINGIKTLINTITTSNGVIDGGKIVTTDNTGKLNSSLFPSTQTINNPSTRLYLYEDFLFGLGSIVGISSGTGAYVGTINVSATDTGGRPGICVMNTGSTATGTVRLCSTTSDIYNRILLGFGVWKTRASVNIPILTTGVETFYFFCGFYDTAGNNATDGLFFIHDTTSTNWKIRCISNNVGVDTITNVVVTAGVWYSFVIEVNQNATIASFFINNILVHTSTTNIPSGVGRQTSWMITNNKTAGTTNRSVLVDYVEIENIFTTAR